MSKPVTTIFLSFVGYLFTAAQWSPAEWTMLKHYDVDHLYHISLPVGGIGTGVIGLGGRGELRNWEIMNKPAIGYSTVEKGNNPPFFAIWVKPDNQPATTFGLMGPLYPAEYLHFQARSIDHHGIPRFEHAEFEAAYPFGQVTLSDKRMPVKVRIKGFNPLIPGDADASGIPVAILTYEVENTSGNTVEVAVCGNMRNFIGQDGSLYQIDWKGDHIPTGAKNNINVFRESDEIRGIYMYSDGVPQDDPAWGTIALTTNACEGVSYRTSSVHNHWSNTAILDFWDDFSEDGTLTEKSRLSDNDPMASLSVKQTIPAYSKKSFTFFITWNFPNRLGWVAWERRGKDGANSHGLRFNSAVFGNYYSSLYKDAWDVAEKTIPQLPALEKKTVAFVDAVAKSDLPAEVKEAALFNLPVLRSQTSFRIASGHFMGWEGTMDITGSCRGSCTHVWNYEQATAFLFGDLSRTMRDVEFNYSTDERGSMNFRAALPLSESSRYQNPAADGQMGCIIKFYRDWQLSGDPLFLQNNWKQVKKVLAFAWVEKGWDANQDGVMEGKQHNTMDVDFYGPNPQMGFWYLGALRAGAEMAKFMKDKEFEKKCNDLFARGSKWIDEHLFNGEYYEHKITDPNTFEFLDMDDNAKIPAFQLGKGCLVDQLVGQYMAHICGLGYLAKPENIRTTLSNIMKYNYLSDFSLHFSNNRSYAIGDESGLLVASWPKGRLKAPFPYFSEVWTGLEYTAAAGMLYEGMTDDALKCIRAVRNRYDGGKRNPFSENECGQHYARSMSSWATILAMTEFHYSGIDKSMSFTSRPGTYFWSNGYTWGTCKVEDKQATIEVLHGLLSLNSFELKGKGVKKLKNFIVKEGERQIVTF